MRARIWRQLVFARPARLRRISSRILRGGDDLMQQLHERLLKLTVIRVIVPLEILFIQRDHNLPVIPSRPARQKRHLLGHSRVQQRLHPYPRVVRCRQIPPQWRQIQHRRRHLLYSSFPRDSTTPRGRNRQNLPAPRDTPQHARRIRG